jgi:flagellar basal body-associated protein FliL
MNIKRQKIDYNKMKLLIIFLFLSVILGGNLSAEEVKEGPKLSKSVLYINLPGAFLINLDDEHVAQIKITVGTRNYDLLQRVRRQLWAPLRHHIHLYLSRNMDYEEVRLPGAREKLMEGALEIAQTLAVMPEGVPGIEEILFTEYKIQ